MTNDDMNYASLESQIDVMTEYVHVSPNWLKQAIQFSLVSLAYSQLYWGQVGIIRTYVLYSVCTYMYVFTCF